RSMPRTVAVPKGYHKASVIFLLYLRFRRGPVVYRLVRRRTGYSSIEIHGHRATQFVFPWQQAIDACEFLSGSPRDSSGYPIRMVESMGYVRVGNTTAFEAQWSDHTYRGRPSIANSYAKIFVPFD